MERQKRKTGTAAKLLAILEGNAKGLSLEEREKKWDALKNAIGRPNRATRVPRAKPQAPISAPRRSIRRTT